MKKKSIQLNFLYNAIYQLLLIVLPLITTPYISRVLGADGVGTFAYTYTIANYFVLFAMLGVKNYGNRSIAAVRENQNYRSKTFWEIYGLQFLCAVIASILYFIYVWLFQREFMLIGLLQGLYVLSGILDISWFFFGIEEFGLTVIRNIVIRLVNLALIFLLVRSKDDLWIYTLLMASGIFLSQAYLWLYLKRFVRWHRPRLKDIASHLRAELILFVPVIAVSLYKMMDKVMLKNISNVTQVGYYESTEKIQNIPLGLIVALGTVMLPRMSNMIANGQEKEGKQYIYHSMIFAMFMACAMMFGIAGIAEDFVPVFLGESYLDCIVLLQVLSPTILFIAWANVIRTQYLIPNHMDFCYIVSVIAGAVMNLVINLCLIPKYAALGAVIGTICAEGCVCLIQTFMVRKHLDIRRYLLTTFPFLCLGAVMMILIWQIRGHLSGSIMKLIAEIACGGILYLIGSGIYGYWLYKESITQFIIKKRNR